MAAMNLAPISSLKLPEISTTNTNNPAKSTSFLPERKPISVCFATSSPPESSATINEKPKIELEFIGPKEGADGKYPVEKATEISGEKLLRNIMLDNKIELYAAYGKVMNCGGGGSCGTCIVEIIDGKDLLNERTNTELRYLKKVDFKARVLEVGLPNNRWKQRKLWKGSDPEIASMEKVIQVKEIISQIGLEKSEEQKLSKEKEVIFL